MIAPSGLPSGGFIYKARELPRQRANEPSQRDKRTQRSGMKAAGLAKKGQTLQEVRIQTPDIQYPIII